MFSTKTTTTTRSLLSAMLCMLAVSCTVYHEEKDGASKAHPDAKPNIFSGRTIAALGGKGALIKQHITPGGITDLEVFTWDNEKNLGELLRVPVVGAQWNGVSALSSAAAKGLKK